MNAPASIHYVLIDYENIQPKNLLLLAQETFHVAFFVGPNQDTVRVEALDLMQRLGSERVKHIKIIDKGKNSLDFHLVYYLGRLIERNPEGHYHIISKDSGYDPLISHLGNRLIKAYRHDDISCIPQLENTPVLAPESNNPVIETKPAPTAPHSVNAAGDLIIRLSSQSNTGKSPLLPLASANFLHAPKKAAASKTQTPASTTKPASVTQPEPPKRIATKTATGDAQEPPGKLTLAKANLDAHKANRPRTLKTLTNHLRAMFQKENLSDADLATLIAKLQNKGILKVAGTKVSYPAS